MSAPAAPSAGRRARPAPPPAPEPPAAPPAACAPARRGSGVRDLLVAAAQCQLLGADEGRRTQARPAARHRVPGAIDAHQRAEAHRDRAQQPSLDGSARSWATPPHPGGAASRSTSRCSHAESAASEAPRGIGVSTWSRIPFPRDSTPPLSWPSPGRAQLDGGQYHLRGVVQPVAVGSMTMRSPSSTST